MGYSPLGTPNFRGNTDQVGDLFSVSIGMWHNAQRLNLIAGALGLLAIYLGFHFAAVAAMRAPQFTLRYLAVTGELRQVAPHTVERAINGRPIGNFFAADLSSIREWVEAVPWVRRATVRRVWPNRLEVRIEEHRPLARWGDTHLVNTHGELFAATLPPVEADGLPFFDGPLDTVALVTQRFARYRERVKPLALPGTTNDLVALTLSPRYAWTLRLADGLTLELGRGQEGLLDDRLERFVHAYPETLARLSRDLKHVDLRYPHGFALRVPDIQRLEDERIRTDERDARELRRRRGGAQRAAGRRQKKPA